MKKDYKTMTYGYAPLRIKNKVFNKRLSFDNHNPEINANVDLETGEVKFFIDKEDLNKLK